MVMKEGKVGFEKRMGFKTVVEIDSPDHFIPASEREAGDGTQFQIGYTSGRGEVWVVHRVDRQNRFSRSENFFRNGMANLEFGFLDRFPVEIPGDSNPQRIVFPKNQEGSFGPR